MKDFFTQISHHHIQWKNFLPDFEQKRSDLFVAFTNTEWDDQLIIDELMLISQSSEKLDIQSPQKLDLRLLKRPTFYIIKTLSNTANKQQRLMECK